MLFLCIERIFGLTSACKNDDCRFGTVIPVRSTEKVGELIEEKED
jgi:hypothetical protein